MIEVRGVSHDYAAHSGTITAVRDVDLSLAAGELVVVLGANGSGKSTLARIMAGLLVPASGEVLVDGLSTRDIATAWDIRRLVGVVFQNPDNQIVGTVVEEDVAFGPENLGLPREEIRRRVDLALEAVGLAGFERREPHLLSGGQKQRLAIAGALAMSPTYLVLDEPTAMLDRGGRSDVLEVLEALRATGRGILHVTHHLADAAKADRVAVMDKGALAFCGSPAELMAISGRFSSLGLELPPVAVLAKHLREGGLAVSALAMDSESVVQALWR
jgi:energy-coupling factor transport system ATP-binding protein